MVVQNPDFFGSCHSLEELADHIHSKGALLIVVVNEVISLGMMKSPGDMGADIVACEGQSLGNPLNFGGPYIGLMSTKDKYVRQLPGRIVGETNDMSGEKGFVLTLATREQHIRREKATSNICTNSGLCSLAFTIHLSLLGERGFKKLSKLNHEAAIKLYDKLKSYFNKSIYDDFDIYLIGHQISSHFLFQNMLMNMSYSYLTIEYKIYYLSHNDIQYSFYFET